MSEHTKEPWDVTAPTDFGVEWGVDAGRWGIAICADAPGDGTSEGNARRIVACVNACAGMTTGEIEQDIAVGGYSAIVECHQAHIVEVERQRDELLAALERLSFAAARRDNTIGDQCNLIEVRAELAAANRQAMSVIALARQPSAAVVESEGGEA